MVGCYSYEGTVGEADFPVVAKGAAAEDPVELGQDGPVAEKWAGDVGEAAVGYVGPDCQCG